MAQAPLIPPNWQLPSFFRSRLGANVGRQRLMHHDSQLLIVAHQVPAPGETTRRGLLVWLDDHRQWHSSNGEPGKAALHNLLEKYMKQLELFDQQESNAHLAKDYLPLLEGLAPFVRAARNLHDVLQEARQTMPDVAELIDLRDRAYDVSRSAELLQQDARNSMDIAVVRRAEEQAAASNRMSTAAHRLNTMAALFFPLATLGAIFGTTLTENWPWSDSAGPFLLFILMGLLTGVGLAMFVNRPAN